MTTELLDQLLDRVRSDDGFYHKLVSDPDDALCDYDTIDSDETTVFSAMSPDDVVEKVHVSPRNGCGDTCDPSCGNTCTGGSCEETCMKGSCDSTCESTKSN